MKQSEVTSINKQKFLAELGKLLTFMYEEDRQRAMGLYSRMFEEAGDEQALIQALISPTRQAVVVARAYNSNLGRLSLNAETKAAPEDRDENGVPDYVQAIEKVREQAWAAIGVPAAAEEAEEAPAETEEAEEAPAEVEEAEEAPAEAEEAEEAPAEAEEVEEAPAETEEVEEAPAEAEEAEEAPAEAEEAEEAPAEAEEAEEAPAETEEAEEAPAETEEVEEAPAETEEAEEAPAEAEEAEEAPAAAEPDKSAHEGIEFFTLPEEGKETPQSDTLLDENTFNIDSDALRKPRRKAKPFALILYILLAIPLTICAIAVLLVPAILFLALSVAAIICGVVLVSTAFKGFPVFADIMVVLGVSLVLFALGLLFLWTAIWFIGGAIVGVVHGVAVLCEKWCYKEVLEA